MASTVDRAAPDPLDPGFVPVPEGDPTLDVPGMLASRIGDLWASEERRSRQERTDRLLRQASQPAQD
jgi:hypothetical protein